MIEPRRLTPAPLEESTAKRRLGGVSGTRHRPDLTIAAVALVLALMSSSCLPLLLGNAKTLRPGEYSLAVAGAGRTHDLPASIKQAGSITALVELRGGLLRKGIEAGITAQIPVHATWDIKYQFLEQRGTVMPAFAVRCHLGAYQANTGSFGGALLATREIGRIALTAMAGIERTNERLWLEGSSSFGGSSENFVKHPLSAGVGLEFGLSARHRVFLNAVSWDSKAQKEAGEEGDLLGAREGRSWFLAGGIKLNWTPRPKPGPLASLTALRGRILKAPDGGQFEVGQPGIFTAVVYVDSRTRILKQGEPADLDELQEGGAVLIQGLPLPRPATFLARTIELQ